VVQTGSMHELLSWAMAAYMSNPNVTDGGVAALLELNGFPRGLATRAVAFLPLAFGRRLLRDLVALPDSFVAGGREAPLASEPLYVLAEQWAARVGREQIEHIGLRSAEFVAVNEALNAGSKPEDLTLATPQLTFEGPVTGGATAATQLSELLASHGSTLACEARVFPRKLTPAGALGQIDIVVSAPALGERRIIESFAGYAGTWPDARSAAMDKFAHGSLPALLATLEDSRHGDQVEWQTWGDFRVCHGALLRESPPEAGIDFAAFQQELKRRLLAASLSREVHWYRTFVSVGGNGVDGRDGLLDNEEWAPGVDAVTGWAWPAADTPYALRQFFVMVPDPAT
jgi:hypothetical protein